MPTELTDIEFQRLLTMEKAFSNPPQLPQANEKQSYTLKSSNGTEIFTLNIQRGVVYELVKSKLNTSYSRIPIIRVEHNAPPHQNPDGTKVGRDHIHIYREGYGMRWAYPLEDFHPKLFHSLDEFNILFYDFCKYCNIKENQDIQGVI